MSNLLIYNISTGMIICVGTIKEYETSMPGEMRYENAPSDIGGTHYILNNEVTPRPVMPITISGLHLSGVPENAKLWIEDTPYNISGGNVDLSFNFVGTYLIRIELFPYLDFNTEVTYAN